MNRTTWQFWVTTFVAALSAQGARAQSVSFEEIWTQIRTTSPAREAAYLSTESLSEGERRVSRHWLPHVYLDARTYRTNDPGNVFFGLLEQRKVDSTDFSPNSLNHPDTMTFTRGALGVEMPLYEGNMKMNQQALYEHALQAQSATSEQIEVEQFSRVSQAYGSLAVLVNQIQKLADIDKEMTKLIESYKIGQKSNPVGYSGLLGMKSLANRVTGLLEQYRAQQKGYFNSLREMGFNRNQWAPEPFDSTAFAERYLGSAFEDRESRFIIAGRENAKVNQKMADMEKARFLPRFGAVAESYLFVGARDTSNGYAAGVYLQWNLFDPSDFGKHKEAQLKAMASEKQVEAMIQQENAERNSLQEQNRAMKINLKLLLDSDQLLHEQMKVATTLFRNGSISALQLVEILNRRTDLVVQQSELELSHINVASTAITKTNFQIPNFKK